MPNRFELTGEGKYIGCYWTGHISSPDDIAEYIEQLNCLVDKGYSFVNMREVSPNFYFMLLEDKKYKPVKN